MAKSFLKLDLRRPLKDGTYPVKIGVGYGKDLYLSTGVSIKPDLWDCSTCKVMGPGARVNNEILSNLLCQVQSAILELRENGKFANMTNAELKRTLSNLSSGETPAAPTQLTFYDVAAKFLATKMGKRTIELYGQTLKKVRAFAGDGLLLETMRPTWLHEFEVFLGGSANGRAIHLRNIRAIFNYALDEEITTAYPFRKFKIKKEDTRKRSLTIEQLRTYAGLSDLSNTDKEYRDMFLLIFYLIGINIADLANLTRDSIVNGRLEYRRQKTGRLYSILLQPEALNIINMYAGESHLLAPFDRYKSYRDYNHHLNDALKRLGLPTGKKARNGVKILAPIEADCSTYWARHTWATLAYGLDVPDETIAAALGHSHGNRVTAIYIDKSAAKVDDANRKVIDYVLRKGEYLNK